MDISQFFSPSGCQLEELETYLDGLCQSQRISQSTSLSSRQQQLLWDAAEGGERLSMDDFVPPKLEPLKAIAHWGKNSLPAFTQFKKVMCRTSDEAEFSGYNDYSLRQLIGDGYFVVRSTSADDADNHGVVIDYTRAPVEKAKLWPPIKVNERRLGHFFYAGNLDYMRRVSQHVTIGRAKKANAPQDVWMPNWFVLCRED